MTKIVLSKGSAVLREMTLGKTRVVIGRHPSCDMQIDDIAISAEHAVIVNTDGEDSYLEDLNSTNGTQVNGQPIRKHFLRDHDVIEIAQYRLEWVVTSRPPRSDSGDRTAHLPAPPAKITILNGVNIGQETLLVKTLTTIGMPDRQVAVIVRRADAYYLSAVEGSSSPRVNGEQIRSNERQMVNGDLIEISETSLRFHCA